MQAPTSNAKRTYVGSLSQVLVVDIMVGDLWSTNRLFCLLELAIIISVDMIAVWAKVTATELVHGE